MALAQETIGLVNDEEFHLTEPVDDSMASADNLPESTGCADDDVGGGELALLLLQGQSAGDGSDVGRLRGKMRAEVREVGGYLMGEFSGG
jgi:hypothetical protein